MAHLYLSGDNTEIILGNYMGDFVKASEVKSYTPTIQQGVALHRFIDDFTDSHATVLRSKELVRPYFKKYAPVVIDVFYDFFLGKNWSTYHGQPLPQFANTVYEVLESNQYLLPTRSKRFLFYLISNNMLVNYSTYEGMEQVFYGMSHRAKFTSGMEKAHQVLKTHETTLQKHFNAFFPDLKQACIGFLENMNH